MSHVVFLRRYVCFVLFCFLVFSLLSLKRRPFVQSFFDIHVPQQPHAAGYNCLCPLFSFCFLFCLFLGGWRFTNILFHYYFRFLVVVCRVPFTFSFRMVFFYLVTTGCVFDIRLLENSINQSTNRVFARGNSVTDFHRDISTEKAAKIVPILCLQHSQRNSPFSITEDWKVTASKAKVWAETVTEDGRSFTAAWRKEEVDAARHRQ